MNRLVRAGLLTGVADGLFSGALAQFAYGSSAAALFRGVATTALGAGALEDSAMTVAGLVIHFTVAFTWSAIFLLAYQQSNWLRRLVDSPNGVFKGAAIFGPLVWVIMSVVVIPQVTHRPPAITYRWWIQFVGHAVFVGLPIVAMIAGGVSRRTHS